MPEIRSSRRDLAKGLAFLGLAASAPVAMAQGAAASGAVDAAVRLHNSGRAEPTVGFVPSGRLNDFTKALDQTSS